MTTDRTHGIGTESSDASGDSRFVLVTAHFTILDEMERGELVHVFVQDAKFNIFFDKDGNIISKNARRAVQKLKGLQRLDDSYVIVHKPFLRTVGYLCADVQGGLSRRRSASEWEKFRLLPMKAALEAKSKGLPLDVVVTAMKGTAAPTAKHAYGELDARVAFQPPTSAIPRIIHQTYSTRTIPDALQDNVQRLRSLNPSWLYQYWNDNDIVDFIHDAFGWSVLRLYLSINPQYGAARADLFRYLCIYHYGGVYLDIKSSTRTPFREIIRDDDEYLLSYWSNQPGGRFGGFGFHPELKFSSRGELQQWHVIAAPGHPLLQYVIEKVLHNIKNYDQNIHGCGKRAVLRTTGPIAYTEAIYPHIPEQNCRMISSDQAGIEYNRLQDHHGALGGPRHYSQLTTPIVI